MNIVLASGSPRRKELLEMIGIDDFIVIPDTSEERITPGLTPAQTVCEIALGKAKNVSLLCNKDDIIIAADTLVYVDNEAIAKPENTADAIDMLRRLSGRRHTVYTGIVLLKGKEHIAETEKTDVFFRELTDDEILAYIKTGEPMDKAGAYGAQGIASIFVRRIEGDFFNVMGLPLCRLSVMLKSFCNISIM
jgi:septum formation protein